MKSLVAILVLVFSLTNAVCAATKPIEASKAMASLPRKPVRSSNIASIGYDAASLTLEVEFSTGSVYQYYNVPESVYRGLMNAASHGSYLAQYVKEVYRYREVN